VKYEDAELDSEEESRREEEEEEEESSGRQGDTAGSQVGGES
jgi:hypothetical protein